MRLGIFAHKSPRLAPISLKYIMAAGEKRSIALQTFTNQLHWINAVLKFQIKNPEYAESGATYAQIHSGSNDIPLSIDVARQLTVGRNDFE